MDQNIPIICTSPLDVLTIPQVSASRGLTSTHGTLNNLVNETVPTVLGGVSLNLGNSKDVKCIFAYCQNLLIL